MPRARNIKPGFFTNEELVELPMATRLLFIGLWTVADREGRMEDRPKRIKMSLFPADDIDVNDCLNQLHDSGFIYRYSVGKQRFIQIINFEKHQNPHKKETASQIPAPGNHGAGTVQATTKADASHADPGFLIPDPGSLIPEVTPSVEGVVASHADDEPTEPVNIDQQRPPDCQHQKIIALYHEILPTNPQIREWTDARAEQLRVRWQEDPRRQNLDWWRKFFERIRDGCPFLTGQKAGGNGRPFRPGLEWIVKRENFVKILEGRYVEDAA